MRASEKNVGRAVFFPVLDGDNLAVIQILNLSGVQGFTACVIFLFKRKQHAADNAEKGEAVKLRPTTAITKAAMADSPSISR